MAALKATHEEFNWRMKVQDECLERERQVEEERRKLEREEFDQKMKEKDERLEREKQARDKLRKMEEQAEKTRREQEKQAEEERWEREREEFNRRMKVQDERLEKEREEFDQQMRDRDERLEREKQARDKLLEQEKQAEKERREREKQAEEERRKIHDEEIKYSLEKTERILSIYGNRYGEMIEAMIRPNLKAKFKALGFAFNKLTHDIEAYEEHKILAEIDALLENGDKVMVVKIESNPSTKDIKEHARRMCKMRDYADRLGDRRKYYGAMGGMVFCKNERNFALGCGFYVIEPSGETFDIIAPEGEYEPRAW
jgi:hypothetical protein